MIRIRVAAEDIRMLFARPVRAPLTAAGAATFLAVAATFLVVAATSSAAATASYYVDCVAGSDSNSGTAPTSAWRSLSPVNSRPFAAGNAINLKRGCTWDGGMIVRSSGTSDSPITYSAYGEGPAPAIRNSLAGTYGSSITVTGDYNVIDGVIARDAGESGVTLRAGADRNIVRNVEVTAAGTGITSNGQYNLLTRNHVHDLTMIVNTSGGDDDYGAVCFWIGGPNNEVSYNRGFNCRAPSYDYGYDGGFVEVWKQGDNTYVHHNVADNTSGFFEIGGSGSAMNIKVSHNVLYNVHGGLCLHNGGTFQISIDDFRFEHNTYYSTTPGYRFLECVTGLTPSMVLMRNNIFHSNVRVASTGTFTHTNNLYFMTNGATVGYPLGSGEKVGDPRFVDAGAQNFRLQSGSPAIDAGAGLDHAADFDDLPRTVGPAPDMGAFEFGSAVAPPSEPVAETVTSLNDSATGTALNQFSYSGTWRNATGAGKYENDDHYSNSANSAYSVRFSGTRAKLFVSTAPWHGKAAVSVDGGPETTIDLYSSGKEDQVGLYTTPLLPRGTHTLTVRVLGTRNPASAGRYVTADRVDVTG
jgi:hypothetical protein